MKTKIELKQAINNRIRQGLDASDLITELANYSKSNTIVTTVKHSELEKQAIQNFNNYKQFKITE